MSDTEKQDEIALDLADEALSGGEKADLKVELADDGGKASAIAPEEGIEELKRRLEQERQGRLNAERRAQEAAQAVTQARTEVDSSNLQLVRTAINTMRQEGEFAKARYRDAMAAGDYDAASEAQEAIADARAKLLQLENGAAAMEEQARQPVRPMPHHDPVEQLASQLSPQSAAWVRAHPEYARNPRLTQKMIAAHNLVTADGIAVDTPEYFSTVERVLGVQAAPRQEEAADSALSAAAAPARRSSPAAAPVSRSGTGTGTRPNVVRLSAEEREMAQMMGMSPEDYARNKVALQREGKIH